MIFYRRKFPIWNTSYSILKSDLWCPSVIIKTSIFITIKPKVWHVLILTDKYLRAINCQTCDTNTIVWCTFQLELVICFVDLVKIKTLFKLIKCPFCRIFEFGLNLKLSINRIRIKNRPWNFGNKHSITVQDDFSTDCILAACATVKILT